MLRKNKTIKAVGFMFRNTLTSIFTGLIAAGLFTAVFYAFALPYSPGETLTPTCTPGTTDCTVVAPAVYSFGANNFSGTGNFVTTGTGSSFGGLTIGSLAGLLKATAGLISVATDGTDYLSPTTGITTTALSTWAGTTNITTLGTIASGTWNASTIGVGFGGTGQNFSLTPQGTIIYFSGTGTMAALGPGTAGQILMTAGASANPAWTTATYPATTTANQVLFSSADNVVGGDSDFTFATDTLTITKIAATTFTGDITLSTKNIVTDTTTGTKIGTATSQKLGFFNATPVVQQIATTDLGTVLSNLGLRAAGTAYPITTSGSVTLGSLTATRVPYAGTAGLLQDSANLTFDGTTLTAGGFTTTGTGKFANLGTFNATPNANYGLYASLSGTGKYGIYNYGPVLFGETQYGMYNYMITQSGNVTSTETIYGIKQALYSQGNLSGGYSYAYGMWNDLYISGIYTLDAGIYNNWSITGQNSYTYGFEDMVTSGGTSGGSHYAFYSNISESSTGRTNTGFESSITPNAATNTATGFSGSISLSQTDTTAKVASFNISSGTINNPSNLQVAMYVLNSSAGTDTGNKKWAFYNASTNTTAGKVFMGIDSVPTYWGTGFDASIYYDGTNFVINPKAVGTGYLSVLGDINTTGTLGAGATTVTNLTDSGLTITRIPYVSTAGLLIDSANLTFDGTTLTAGGFTTTGTITGKSIVSSDSGRTLTLDTTTGSLITLAGSASVYLKSGSTNVAYFDANQVSYYDNKYMKLGASGAAGVAARIWGDWAYQLLPSDQTQRVGTMTIGLSDVDYSVPGKLLAGRNMIICDSSDMTYNFGHTISAYPTTFWQGPTASTTKWGSIGYNDTDFVFNAGSGGANFSALDIKTTGTGTFGNLVLTNLTTTTGTALGIDGSNNVVKLSSSLRYKENVRLLSGDFTKILQLEPKSFNYKGSHSFDIGYIAEDFDSLGLKDLLIYDKEGRPDAIKYDRITVYLAEIIKQQQIDINALKSAMGMSVSNIVINQAGVVGTGQVSGVTPSSLAETLNNLGMNLANGFATLKEIVVDKLTTKTARMERMEMVDSVTGEVWCTWIANGEWQKVKGECAAIAISNIQLPISNETTPTPTPEVTPEVTPTPTQEVIPTSTPEIAPTPAPEVQPEQLKQEVKEEVKQEVKQELSGTIKTEVKKEVKKETSGAVKEVKEDVSQISEQVQEQQTKIEQQSQQQEQIQQLQEEQEQIKATLEEQPTSVLETINENIAETVGTIKEDMTETIEVIKETVTETIPEAGGSLFNGMKDFFKGIFKQVPQRAAPAGLFFNHIWDFIKNIFKR